MYDTSSSAHARGLIDPSGNRSWSWNDDGNSQYDVA